MKESQIDGARLIQPEGVEATEGRILIWEIERLLDEAKRLAAEEGARIDWGTLRIEVGPETMHGYGGYVESKAELHALIRRETDGDVAEALHVVATMLKDHERRGR